MEPKELIAGAAKRGIRIARSTLNWYVKMGLIPAPEVRSLGRGRGAVAIYPPEALAELVASKTMMGQQFLGERITAEELAEVRRYAYELTPGQLLNLTLNTLFGGGYDEGASDKMRYAARIAYLVKVWLEHRARVLEGLPPKEIDLINRTWHTGNPGDNRPVVETFRLHKDEGDSAESVLKYK